MAEGHDLSTVVGWEGYDAVCSDSEFTEYLNPQNLLSETFVGGARVFCMANNYRGSAEALIIIQDKIKRLLLAIITESVHYWLGPPPFLVQFWAPGKVVGKQLYLTTSDQPFAVGHLCRGLCWYRKHSVNQAYVVDVEGAKEEERRPVGRVFRNGHPESTWDLRLYFTTEFPFRDHAARCGARAYLALPVFDLLHRECYGVLEVLCFGSADMELLFIRLARGLREAGVRSTHTDYVGISRDRNSMPPKYKQREKGEIENMLEAAIQVVPQLHLAQTWVPCKQCANTTSNLCCMERAAFVNAADKAVNLCNFLCNYDNNMFKYLEACEFHNLQVGKGTIAGTVMSSNNKSCFCRNVCDFNISENPLAHYAQKARLSFYFGICVESVHNSDNLCFIEFFLQPNCREDPCGWSFLHLLFEIMKTELKSFKVPSSVIEVRKDMLLSSVQFVDHGINLEHAQGRTRQRSEEFNMLTVMEGYDEIYSSEADFAKYLQKDDHLLSYFKPPEEEEEELGHGWLFWYPEAEELSENVIQKKIKLILGKMISDWKGQSYCLVQFWVRRKNEDHRIYLTTSGQPFALGGLHKGLGFFRKRCVEHQYFADEWAKEEELGPPGRAFRSGHPEMTSDVHLYSTTEFPLKNDSMHCDLQGYIAFPVFDHQHQCVGILEFLGYLDYDTLECIKEAVEAGHLSSARINFEPISVLEEPSSPASFALTEIEEAFLLVRNIPQLHMAEAWIACKNCVCTSNSMTCMEPVAYGNLCPLSLVQTGKGIAGMLLASENKSCFCRNSCNFTITEQSWSHHAQKERLDVCFAICLQSSHTGDLPYVLEFFLNQGPGNYEYLCSFLYLLLPIMKQKLQSFKVALGRQLGEELVVDIIEFSRGDQPHNFFEFGQPNAFPVKFQIVQYDQKEHQQSEQQVNFVLDGMDSVTSVVAVGDRCTIVAEGFEKDDEEHQQFHDHQLNFDAIIMDFVTSDVVEGDQCTSTAADDLEKDDEEHEQYQDEQVNFVAMDSVPNVAAEGDRCASTAADDSEKDDTTEKTEVGKRKNGLRLSLEDLEPHFGKKLKEVADELGVARSTIKRACRYYGIERWPSKETYKKNPSLFNTKSNANEHARHSHQNMRPSTSSSSSLPVQQIVPQTKDNTKSTRNITLVPEANTVVVKAKFEDDIVKFQFSPPSGMDKLVEGVATRLNLKIGSFKLKYLDEDNDKISLTCEADLQQCLKSLTAAGENCFQVFVHLIRSN